MVALVSGPEVSGKAFLGVIRYVKDARGSDFLGSVVDAGAASTKAVFARPIRAGDWHPYEAYAGFLRGLERSMGRGDGRLARQLGEVAGKRDLGTVFRVYVALASAERLIRACSKVWPSYYRNAGTMEAIAWEPTDTRLRITGFAEMEPLHCRLMEGWMIATMNTIGFSVSDDASETRCSSRGAPYHEFACTWTKRP
jgi:hypothetical protein